jgi:hypothetical protein
MQFMAMYDLPVRRARYFTLSSQLAQLDNAQLHALFEANELRHGWGKNHTLDIGRSKVFVKRLPLTDIEYENMFSTKNLYDLPTYYNYGVGSAGFGAFRELVANIKTTNWVLEGAIAYFPMLYHYRMLPFSGERPAVDMERHQRYVAYWNGNENIGKYMLARANAKYELALFLEHMPYAVEPWLREHPQNVGQVVEDLRDAVTFLRKKGIIHFDAHFDNVLSDGEHAYLTDFGLVLDKQFNLTDDEALFLKQNTYYDYSEVLGSLGFSLYDLYDALTDSDKQRLAATYGISEELHSAGKMSILLDHIEKIIAEGIIRPDKHYTAIAVKYRSIIMLFLDFFASMRANKQKDTKFPSARLARLLKETEFLSGKI